MKKKKLEKKRDKLLSFVSDCLLDFLYYDRKNCEEVSLENVREMSEKGILTPEMLIEKFTKEIEKLRES